MEVYNNLKKDLDDYLTKTMEPINQKQLSIERKSFNKFLEKHDDRYEILKANHTNFIWQIITLEGVIFGGIMLFHDKSFVSTYLYFSLFCLLLSIILGLILQRLRISSDYWLLNFKYELRKGSNDFARKLYHDVSLDWEKDRVGTKLGAALAAPPFAASKLYGKYRQNSIFLSFKKYFEPTFFAMIARSWQLFSARAILLACGRAENIIQYG